MKFVRKRVSGGYHLDLANNSPPLNKKQASSRWSSFGYKPQVSQSLFFEQYGLCMYSEVRPDLLGFETHIEHIKPKSIYPVLTFEYKNLGLSALSSDDLKNINKKDIFGAHAKKNIYDQNRFISYLQSDCARYFVYLSNGKVQPSNSISLDDQAKAEYTIELLNLNCDFLIVKRRNWIDEIDELIENHINDGMCLQSLASIDLVPTSGKLKSFFTATRQRFGNVAEEVLINEAPGLL